jgi:putative oxidoreductase
MYDWLEGRRGTLMGAVPVIVRVVFGGMMFAHGMDKLINGPAGFGSFLTSLGLPAGTTLGWVVTLLELLGGAMLVVGLLSRPVALLLALELIAAIVLVSGERGLISMEGTGYERDLAYIAGFLVVTLVGPGRPSLDQFLGLERPARNAALART